MNKQQPGFLKRNNNITDGFFLFLLSVALLVYSLLNHYSINSEWSMSPYLFPLLVAFFIGALSLTLIDEGVKQIKSSGPSRQDVSADRKSVLVIIGFVIVYYVLLKLITFIPASIIFLSAGFVFLGERRKWLIALLAGLVSVIIYILFKVLLNVMLP